MASFPAFVTTWHVLLSSVGREQKIRDYVELADRIAWKRQASFLAAALLATFYFDPISVVITYVFVVITEIIDMQLGEMCKAWDGADSNIGDLILRRIAINTVLSAFAISIFSLNIAVQQESGGHFTPLFFLFSASVFAAMYNSQMILILSLRLIVYGLAFFTIALQDIIPDIPPLRSSEWLEFFTVVFVLYFICEISLKFNESYRDRRRQMQLLKEEHERTKKALEIKTRFLATVSHELRTPLTSIIGSLELINSDRLGSVPDKIKPAVNIAARNSRRLVTLIEDLLDLQKIEAGEMNFKFSVLDANMLVEEAVDSISGYAAKLGVEVVAAISDNPCHISGDHGRLIQVMNNLLSNAIKFSQQSDTVTVQVENIGNQTRLSVQDQGDGIPEGSEEIVFGKFSQVDSSDIRKVGGTGLGLNISKLIVEHHGGEIYYTSTVGVGSIFYVEFETVSGSVKTDDASEHLLYVA